MVVHPDGGVVPVKETGVPPCRAVVWTLVLSLQSEHRQNKTFTDQDVGERCSEHFAYTLCKFAVVSKYMVALNKQAQGSADNGFILIIRYESGVCFPQ